ncbi:endonuclease/exonuclease/phosphatase family protein [Agrococcus sp. SCSIO52902]|uniref:endonuclease/exonuclease/phosphatase family protein n=1 Tax=Agrococcus sp. SCSIO52902 TaxID=2933290 RepID=UPI001FF201A8|nr:endonuclease/exonuclease/phosphatase family protein [Agrococcus sp. SCSIO52902]UOW00944.1 endonuclease/exonuclease/phosphatase family protein [Agrococcus sp. SCSIO52902]
MLVILGWLLALVIAACLAVAAWPQALGLEQAPVVAQVVSMRVGVIGIALVLAVVALAFVGWRRVRPFVLGVVSMLLVFALVSGGIHASRGLDDGQVLDRASDDLIVLTWNTLGDEPGAEEIARVIDETGADAVMLPETTLPLGVEVAELLGARANPFWVHTTDYSPSYGALNTTLLISAALGEYTTDLTVGGTRTLPTVVARPDDGDGPVLVSAHPVAPVPQQMRNWRADLDFVAGLCDGSDSVVMAGDFNSTLDHWWSTRTDDGDLGTCRDAASAVGAGAVGSWPTWAPPWLGAQIDHVVATPDWEPVAARVLTGLDDVGTDHRPVLVQLRYRG